MRLAVDPRDGRVTLTLPPRASMRQALAWAESRRGWVEAALARVPAPRAIVAGGRVPFRGEEVLIDWDSALPRAIRIEGDRLRFGGPAESLASRVLAWLRQEARRVLDEETRVIASRVGVSVGRVGVGDPRARWGSCSARGDIRYNWRLILAPDFVRRATVAHEVSHIMHMDHGPLFHALVAELLGDDPRPARDWLRREGAKLHRIGAQ